MNLIIEGPDGAGKSTLGRILSDLTGMELVQGNGPPKSKGEFLLRVETYLGMQFKIFDRHPCISDRIYGPLIRGLTHLTDDQLRRFHAQKNFIIYVQPDDHLLPQDHECKDDHETPEHVAGVEKHHGDICRRYDAFMLRNAHYIYRRAHDAALANLLHCAAQFPAQSFPPLFPSSIDVATFRRVNACEGFRWWPSTDVGQAIRNRVNSVSPPAA